MECVRLKVQTVPALDPATNEQHTSYLVLRDDHEGGWNYHATGWTLRDAIDNYCKWFRIERNSIILIRPFRPQWMGEYDCL